MPRAERDLALIFRSKDAEQSNTARKWYLALRDEILTLENHPERCTEALEGPAFRELLYGTKPHIYRII
jgi:plasmid stabilization system protein ParE